jgi:hypothetical protein
MSHPNPDDGLMLDIVRGALGWVMSGAVCRAGPLVGLVCWDESWFRQWARVGQWARVSYLPNPDNGLMLDIVPGTLFCTNGNLWASDRGR